jgi:hypothetical protein
MSGCWDWSRLKTSGSNEKIEIGGGVVEVRGWGPSSQRLRRCEVLGEWVSWEGYGDLEDPSVPQDRPLDSSGQAWVQKSEGVAERKRREEKAGELNAETQRARRKTEENNSKEKAGPSELGMTPIL